MGLCSHTSSICRQCGITASVGLNRDASITWSRSPPIADLTRARNGYLNENLDERHMKGLESSDHHRGSLVIDHDRGLHPDAQTAVMRQESDGLKGGIATHLDASISIGRWIAIGRSTLEMLFTIVVYLIVRSLSSTQPEAIGRLAFVAEDFFAIAVRSPRDRGAIEPRSWLTHGAIMPRFPLSDGPRFSCDRGHHFHRIKRP